MILHEITSFLESIAPLSLQEDYDNSGLIIGDTKKVINSVLICLDVTEDVVDEAIKNKHDLIISHHPIIFKGLKKIEGKNYVERIIISAIKNDIAIYAIHTNFDNILSGVNKTISEKLNLKNIKLLKPKIQQQKKLIVYCPDIKLSNGNYVPGIIRNALFKAGAGFIGNYDSCSFNTDGLGTYRGLEGTKPLLGEQGKRSVQKEVKIETIFPSHLQEKIVSEMLSVHPYEEVAYDIYPLDNKHDNAGSGLIGELSNEMDENEFLSYLKDVMKTKVIRHSKLLNKKVKRIAINSGTGSFLLKNAIKDNAVVFISSDFKYHEFFDANEKLVIADIGHYESEQFTIDLLYELLTKKFPTFAFLKTNVLTNPIYYLW